MHHHIYLEILRGEVILLGLKPIWRIPLQWLARSLFVPLFLLQGEIPVAVVNSEYFGDIFVTRSPFRLNVRSSPVVSQTSLNLFAPWKQCHDHYRMVARVMENMERIESFLMFGVAGGGFLHTARQLHPEASMDAVDIDPAMLKVARKYFNIPDATLIEADALDFIRGDAEKYDFIYVDVSGGMYPPQHLLGKEFIGCLARSLAPGGVVCMNSVRAHPWDGAHRRFKSVFAECFASMAEYVSKYGRAMPLLPHNVILAGANSRDVTALMRARPFKPRRGSDGKYV